jgi:alpha-beta hydrolase superfamily lysophospholipase
MILNTEMKEVMIRLQRIDLPGNLIVPEHSKGIILFSHGSGSSRLSPRNNYVAKQLNKHRFATLLFDLLSKKEDLIYQNRFDIELLTQRLSEVTNWVLHNDETKNLPIGYFGASTGAASALKAAGTLGKRISAVVSRGGRPDLAGPEELKMVSAPTLLIVGEMDREVINLNKMAYEHLNCEKSMALIPGATHLFEEPGTLEKVTEISAAWFENHLK